MMKGRLRPATTFNELGPDSSSESNTLNSGGRSIFTAHDVQLRLKLKAT